MTGRNQLEQELQQRIQESTYAEEKMRSVVNSVVDGIISIDDHGTVESYNPAAEKIFGYQSTEVVGKNVRMLMPEPFYSQHEGFLANYMGTGETKIIGIGREVVGRHKDGTRFPMDLTVSEFHLGQHRFFTGIIRNISKLNRAEEALRESEERFQELITHIHKVFWVIDAKKSKLLYVSPAYETMWGRSCQSLMNNPYSYLEGIYPLDQEKVARENCDMYKTGHIDVESRVLRPDGSIRWVWIRSYPVMEQGQILRLVGVIEDITEKKRVSMERDELLSRFQFHIERLPLAYILFDSDFRIIDWNFSAERIFGYTKGEMLGTGPPFEKFVPHSFWQHAKEVLSRIRSGDMQANSTNENLTKDGRTITCEWSNTPLVDDDGTFTGMLCLAQDVTERKALEAQVQQAQKMEVVGHLAGGVAHDFNNLLAVILGCSQLLENDTTLSGGSQKLVEDVYTAASRAATLIGQLLAFSRHQVLQPKVLNLNEVVIDSMTMLERLIGEDIALKTTLYAGLWPAKVDAGQMNQVIMNLAVNARDAMKEGGTLTVVTSNVDLHETSPQSHRADVKSGPHVVLSVSDTGCGLDEKTKARIFEPFFTTKEKGKGTGLGLATVLEIINRSGGHITVESQVGKGTTFKMYLPKDETVVESSTLKKSHSNPPRGTETVMIVDDEDIIRNLTYRILQSLGYTVLQAHNGEAALQLYNSHQGPIHLIVTDVVMPKMGGYQLYERLRAIQPNLKILFTSGYTDDIVLRHGVLESETNFIQKPFMYGALANAVRTVLDLRI